MNPWYILGLELTVLFALLVGFTILLVMLIATRRRGGKARTKGILLSVDTILLICAIVYLSSHPTYYKYNDMSIIGSDITAVCKKYGDFDRGEVHSGQSGRVAYYIYTDDGPIMPDHMEHYYWIYFDENGTVYKVEDNTLPGG